jgi:hypothetical protein
VAHPLNTACSAIRTDAISGLEEIAWGIYLSGSESSI